MKVRLRKSDRWERILREVEMRPHVRIADLAALFGVSNETVRRDLEALSEEGLIARSFGGAAAAPMGVQPPFGERNRAYVEERARIGRCACDLVQPNDVLMIDAGSTNYQLAKALAATARDLIVLTNSLAIAATLGQSATIEVIVCPGKLNSREAAVFGTETVDFLARYNADKAFISASGISHSGITDANLDAVAIKRRMLARGLKSFVLADHSKLHRQFVAQVASLADIEAIITDEEPDAEFRSALDRFGVTALVAP
ncbi:DeoR/GlpR family DNA-binding transcription regulator [Aureimonas frigidaquae]|uniref:DeoR/GlpR family DNA-binding transcription regulator n=1 Tax=Aureimonas frigidaquae TaxID=424757 RepID=UPI0009FAC172|nr:DeoR/GlpR family DNA-binding transcription regulator [Aureimonas frigidaquae]